MISCRAGLVVLAVVVVAAVVAVYFISKSFSSADQSSGANSPGPRATSTLQFLIVVNRHGNRGFYSSFPTNPYPINDTNFWPFGAGQLTVKGRDQLYALGTKIRSLYNGFLSDLYFPEDFKASSTLIDRTLQSGLMFLAGLFPPKGFEIWDGSILWQPIPLYPTHLDRTRMVSSAVSEVECPKFNLAQKQSLNKFLEVYGSNVTGLLNSMQPYTGMTVEPQSLVFDMMRLWDSLACVDSEGLSLPAWTKSFYPEPMADLAEKLYTAFTIGSDDMIRYLQGELFKEMVGLMRSKANNTLSPDRRMYYYSGHDHTLMGLLGYPEPGGCWDKYCQHQVCPNLRATQRQPNGYLLHSGAVHRRTLYRLGTDATQLSRVQLSV
ncbi:prostatic acid phosphatase-like [Homalodisca vitripennis]|uniref:prostatic acid phosphatase-like n=1 Tax=Homalodisca vitripennis TaxID=197043 RepID=UPI001EEAB4C9|nr:prostatic acid phosphatase-like [Homalodisca vitripennis]